jgi:hypothetical protein
MATISLVRTMALVSALIAVAAVTGCGAGRSKAEAIPDLQSPEWEVRQEAADHLRRGHGPPPAAVPHLMAAIQKEQNARAYGAILMALGKSGAPEALPHICGGVHAADEDMRRWGKNALRSFLEKNHGSPGCPPPGTPVAATPAVPLGAPPPAPAGATQAAPPPGWEPAPAAAAPRR